ncbi:DUF3857 domain-containing protein [Seonamhaeicola maritimus]|uniref:DUF3857 domain-containing protein n=1 Tax=Seonamhaeicola maritimus TaxID=2591822 RepID=UPI00249494C0|nr:DUF3857 domain-containing protein [Seonamhaeicola maritimus]
MNVKHIASTFLFLVSLASFSQEKLYTSATIPDNLIQNANAVVRLSETNVEIKSISEMIVTRRQVITVLNKNGNRNVESSVYYDNNIKVKELKAFMYNDFGLQTKKFKKNDFKDVSAVDGGTLYSDARNVYLDFTPIKYPYTLEFISVTSTGNTAFIPSFTPARGYYLSVENSSYSISSPPNFNIRKKEQRLDGLEVSSSVEKNTITCNISNIEAYKPEEYSPPFRSIIPKVLFASNEFNYEGVRAKVEDWKSMGKWFHNNLLKGRTSLPAGTISAIKALINDDDNNLVKAKKVYKYVQDNTRYIGVQVGIGGMQPISAMNVDRVKYGDCKGLTNYTKSLLDVVGVKSYYTRLYASPYNRLDVDKDFVSFGGQTNHVILNIPQEEDEDIWLECTSQKLPFGFIGDFTDDRDVLVITPEGGKIVHTKKYEVEENLQTINGICNISNEGAIGVKVKVVSKGIQYDSKYGLAFVTDRDLDSEYKERWRYINGLNIEKMTVNNDRDNIEFVEDISFNASNYSKVIGERMLVPLNALNRSRHVPDRYRNRKLPLQVKRGFKDVDVVEIKLPSDYKIESQPQDILIENKFGSYKMELEVKDENTLIYNREFIIKDGDFPKEDYSGFRDFYKEVSKKDNAKIALIKK